MAFLASNALGGEHRPPHVAHLLPATVPFDMLMFIVDTNVLVYAADENSPAHAACKT